MRRRRIYLWQEEKNSQLEKVDSEYNWWLLEHLIVYGEASFFENVSAKTRLQDINVIQSKLRVNESYKKD